MTVQVELLNDWCGENLTLSGHAPLLHDGRDPLPTEQPNVCPLTLGPSETAPGVWLLLSSLLTQRVPSAGWVLEMSFTGLGGTDYKQTKTPASD